MRYVLLSLILMSVPLMSSAQKMLTASGDYTYYAPQNITVEQAKAIAIERAKINIIADHFGTVVGVSNSTTVSNVNGESSVSFLSIGESEVKGEWIETIGDPDVEVSYKQNMLVVNVRIKGRIREIKSARIPFKAALLRNSTDDRNESYEYKDGDYLYLSFTTPESGYVAVYLYDKSGVSRLLPMKSQRGGSQYVEADRRVVFFSHKNSQYSADLGRYIDSDYSEYTLFCNEDNELNRIYVIFSPNKFSRPLDNVSAESDMPAMLTFEDFQAWLVKSRKQDAEMCLEIKDLIIRK